MNETLKTMWTRRSIRRYRPDPIPEEDLHLILEAARRAPTGGNRQLWRMVVVTDPELRRKTADACNGQMWMADAPVILCVAIPPGQGKVNGAIVLDHAILAATSLGYGTCWIGAFQADEVERLMNAPRGMRAVMLVPMGYPAREGAFTEDAFRKDLSEMVNEESF